MAVYIGVFARGGGWLPPVGGGGAGCGPRFSKDGIEADEETDKILAGEVH